MDLERYFSQDDGESGFPFSLNEKDWHSYLAAIDSEAGKFFKLFIEKRYISNHLDIIFSEMSWKKIFFNGGDCVDDDVEVVTFHKNPVNIASKAIFLFMEKIWDILLSREKHLSVELCWRFAKLMNIMQNEMLSGIANIDSCEYVLAVCHFKNVMAVVNRAMSSLELFPDLTGAMSGFMKDFIAALFDIRELAWQSIVLCNISEHRYNDGTQF
ncbi:MAG: hypothetical protein LBI56_01940 [Puniceicoccales bacterium]|jgi:hypothetical protein|nr:hypothetical protein [Puniceicoccales bacterium]